MSLLHNSKHKLQNVYRTIDRLLDGDFPFVAGKSALRRLRAAFENLETRLDRAARTNSSDTISTLANNINLKIFQVMPILGVILRSTNIRNAFELLDPLQTIASETLQGKPQLIYSSEWDYVPFAYPQSLEDLKSFVLIGMPASEAASALLVPLAGHELGHAVWRNRGLDGGVAATIQYHCLELYDRNLDRFKRIFTDYKPNDIVGRQVLPDATAESVDYAVRQAEELFCDLFAYSIFGASYLNSFSYILAPGSGTVRDPNYPLYGARISAIQTVAAEEDVQLPGFTELGFAVEARRGDTRHCFMVEMAENAVQRIIKGLWEQVTTIVSDAKTRRPDAAAAERHLAQLQIGVPTSNPTCLGDIVNAGWLYHAQVTRTARSPKEVSEKLWYLNEMLLKSIEVLEYHRRVK